MVRDKVTTESTLVLGIGNILLGDEGFGVHVARGLKEVELPDNVRVEEGGVGGFNLLGLLEDVRRLVIIDIMMIDLPAGEMLFFKPGLDFTEPGKRIISFHQVGVIELIQMWSLLEHEPEVFFLVTHPERMEWNLELSPPLHNAAERAVKLITELCWNNFTGLERSQELCTQ